MSLLDHFRPPLATQRHWEGFHSKWASAIVDQLNEQLPPHYFAEPHLHRGSQIEIDVATFEELEQTEGHAAATTLVWSPARPMLLWLNTRDAVPVDLASSYEATCRSLRIDLS